MFYQDYNSKELLKYPQRTLKDHVHSAFKVEAEVHLFFWHSLNVFQENSTFFGKAELNRGIEFFYQVPFAYALASFLTL